MEFSSSSDTSSERDSKETRENEIVELSSDDSSMVSLPFSSDQNVLFESSVLTCTPVRASPVVESIIWTSIVRLMGLVKGAE